MTLLWRDGRLVVSNGPAGPDDGKISLEGFGSIKLLSTLADAVRSGRTLSSGCSAFIGINGGASQITASAAEGTGEISALSTTEPGYRTLSGVAIGSTDSEVRAVYGANLHDETVAVPGNESTFLVLRSPQARAADTYLWFIMYEGRVHGIDLLSANARPKFC